MSIAASPTKAPGRVSPFHRRLTDISSTSLTENVTTTLASVLSDVVASASGGGDSTSTRLANVTRPCAGNSTLNASSICENNSTNSTSAPPFVLPHALWLTVILGILVAIISLVTILGNIMVLLAFGLERTIRQPTNYFLASLAVSDLLIGTFSMPMYTQYLLWGKWPLGPWLCDLWLSLDWTVCLTSQYTVFLITMDRFLSVKIPAKYRNWRTERKVLVMISVTWILPAIIFFTSIIGWQFFVGKRTVAEDVCEVQFMGDTMFTFLLTIGYYWITLFVMCTLYGGIYKVALDLQRKSDAKQKKMQSTMELAGDNPNAAIRNFAAAEAEGNSNNSSCGGDSQAHSTPQKNSRSKKKNNRKSVKAALPCPIGAQNVNMTNFNAGKPADKDDDRSSSPAFASDDENSSSGERGGGGGGGTAGAGKSPVGTAKSNQQGSVVNSVLFANTGGLVRSLHGDLFFTANADRRENQTLLLQPPSHKNDAKSFTESCSDMDGGHSHEFDSFYSSVASDKLEKQTTPLLQNEINKGCRFIDETSFLATLSSENAALLPVIAGESGVEDSDMAELPNSSPIWKRRSSLPPLASDVFDIDDNVSDSFINTDFPTMSTTLVSNYKYPDLDQGPKGDSAIPIISTIPESASEDGHAKSQSHANNNNNSNCMNAPASDSNTNEDSSRSDTHCLAAVRRRRNKDTRLHTFVKSVRSRNSRRRNRRERKSKSENRARKALRTISFILGAFVLCWTPYHVAIMIIALCARCMELQHTKFYQFSYWLCYLNSPINPFCYAFANAQFKRTFIRIMRFDWHRT